MRQFLTATLTGATGRDALKIALESDARSALASRGYASPVFPAFGSPELQLDKNGVVLLLFPTSPRQLLFEIARNEESDVRNACFVSHGLASVGALLPSVAEAEELMQRHQEHISHWELWALDDGQLSQTDIVAESSAGISLDLPPELTVSGLPYDAATQVRQFNASVASVLAVGTVFTPELGFVITELHRSVASVADEIRSIGEAPSTLGEVQQQHVLVSVLVEVNSALAMVTNQTLGGCIPLFKSDYPVGEFSLLGVGGASRGLLRIYSHLYAKFGKANSANRLKSILNQPGFDPFTNQQTRDYLAWEDSPISLASISPIGEARQRMHLVYFSARFGYHETASTMGASWQSIHASASREWNLLTLSHEFLHSHVRQLTAAIFSEPVEFEELAARLEPDADNTKITARTAFQLAFVSVLRRLRPIRLGLDEIEADGPTRLKRRGVRKVATAAEVRSILDRELAYLQEIVVHVLDYLYLFPADDETYVSSIWSSWAMVPDVVNRIHNYTLRSLCALSSTSPDESSDGSLEAFNHAAARLELQYERMLEKHHNIVIAEALLGLQDETAKARLQAEFTCTYYIVRLTKSFLFDEGLAGELRSDDEAAGEHYGLAVGEALEAPIESPLLFLQDRFRTYDSAAAEKGEYESLWQLLVLIDPEECWQ